MAKDTRKERKQFGGRKKGQDQKNDFKKKEDKEQKRLRPGKKIIGKPSKEILSKKIGKAPKAKKHKKIKAIDPFYHGERKNVHEKKLKNKAPKNNDDDQFPGRLKEILRYKAELERKEQEKKEQKRVEETEAVKTVSESYSKKNYIPVPNAQESWPKPQRKPSKTDGSKEDEDDKPLYVPEGQKEGETATEYLRRANKDLTQVFEKTMLFQKFGIDFTDMNSGKMEKLYGMNDKKRQRLKEIAKDKKERRAEKQTDNGSGFEHLTDDVVFGEVCMAPPDKLAKPRKAPVFQTPGKKALLLKEIMEQNSKGKDPKESKDSKDKDSKETAPKTAKPEVKKKRDKHALKKTVKLKYLAPVRQVMLNAERERVVQLYRDMKKKKRQQEA